MINKEKIIQKKKNKKTINGWRILFRHLFSYKKEVIILSLLGMLSAIANGTIPYIIGKFFDGIIAPSTVEIYGYTLPLWLALILLFIVLQLFADIVDWKHAQKNVVLDNALFASYRANNISRLLYLPLSFHKNRKLGKITETIFRAGSGITNIISQIIVRLSPQFLSIIIGFAIALYIHAGLAMILAGGVLFYIVTLTQLTSSIGDLVKKGNRAWGEAHSIAYESIANIDVVKKFTTEKREEKNIKDAYLKKAARRWSQVELKWNQINFLQRIIVTVTRSAIFIFSVYLISDGTITLGELIAFNGYAMMFFGPFVLLGQNWQSVQNGIVALEETERLIKTPPEVYAPENAQKMNIKGNVTFKNVYFKYKDNGEDTLKGLNFDVKSGDTIALVGGSGVGKSTVIDLLPAFYFARKGKVLIDGVDIKNINLYTLRNAIAIVPQEVSLFNETIMTNIKYGNFKTTESEVKEAAKKAHADVFIDKFPKKYKTIVGERGVKLSVGQKQRVAIARAILRNPKILILDEPTSALDSKTERFITESLGELMKGRTTFIAAHRLSTVRKADKILVFEKGRIVEEGDHEHLMKIKDGTYKNMYEHHIGLQ